MTQDVMLLQKRVEMLLLLDELWHQVTSDNWVLMMMMMMMQMGAGVLHLFPVREKLREL